MKRELGKGAGLGILATLIIVLTGCGGTEPISTNLTTGEESSGGGTGISNVVDSPCDMGIGDLLSIEFENSSEVAVDFSCVESGAKFILAVGSYNEAGSGTSIQLAAGLSLEEPSALTKGMLVDAKEDFPEEDAYGPEEIFSAWLRAAESELHVDEVPAEPEAAFSASKAMGIKAGGVGDTETFKVLSSLTTSTSYVEITGEVRCTGEEVVFYVDTDVSRDNLSDADVADLCADFDVIAGEEQDLLGDISDVDGDGKLHVLMTKQINRLGALGGGIITGYFYAADLYSQSGSNPVSNHREIIYTMVPDPSGAYGTVISHDFAMSNLLPAVFPHELQHAISYNQHVFVNGAMPEENWLNEGLSHLMEDWAGHGVENPSRYAMYLASPSTYGVVTQGAPNLMERGAAYLFLRFLYEQSADGDAFLHAMENTALRGVSNLEIAFDGPSDLDDFSEFISRWVAALSITNRGISQDSRYTYEQRSWNSATGNWEGVCLICDPDDNRGTQLSGVNLNRYYGYHVASVDAGTAKFYDVSTLPDEMRLSGTAGGGNFGLLVRYQ